MTTEKLILAFLRQLRGKKPNWSIEEMMNELDPFLVEQKKIEDNTPNYVQQIGRGPRLLRGTKILVHDKLITEVTRIDGEKIYFNDEEGKEWQATLDEIKVRSDQL